MSMESKRMRQRYGTYEQFQTDKVNLFPNEFASVTSGDVNTSNGKALYFNFGSDECQRILTDEDTQNFASSEDVYIKQDVDGMLDLKANKSTTLEGYGIVDSYTKDYVDMRLSNKADKASVYTKTAADTNFVNINDYQRDIDSIDIQFTTKADKATTRDGYGITDVYTKSDTDNLLNGKVNSSNYNQKVAEIEDRISTIAPDETIYDDTAYDDPNAPANNNHLMVFFGSTSDTNISLGLPPLTSADSKTVFHFEISFIQSDMSKVVLQENESGTIKTYEEYTPASGETIEFDYTMTSAAVTSLRMRMYERAGAQEVKVKITKDISVEDYAYSKGEVYNKTEIDDTLTDKADYVKNDNVNKCLGMGSIYKTVVQFGGEQLTAVLFSCNDMVDHHIAQLAFTENGKLLFRFKEGTSWGKNDPFILFGGGS